MEGKMIRRRKEALGCLGMIDWTFAAPDGTARLRLALRMVSGGGDSTRPSLGMVDGDTLHGEYPFRIWAMCK
jgi:hypothetical protein